MLVSITLLHQFLFYHYKFIKSDWLSEYLFQPFEHTWLIFKIFALVLFFWSKNIGTKFICKKLSIPVIYLKHSLIRDDIIFIDQSVGYDCYFLTTISVNMRYLLFLFRSSYLLRFPQG